VITVPGSLIGTALGDVYRQHATETFRSQGRFDRLFIRTATMTFCLALPPLFVLVCFAPTLFAFVFGPHWRPAGDFARILAIAAFVQFVCLPVDKSAIITGRTGYLLLWNLLMAAGVLGLWSFVVFGGMSFESFLLLYTALVSIMYLFDLSMQYIFSWRPRQSGAT
jgi:O-antigen/teichoic acid export membrane protein